MLYTVSEMAKLLNVAPSTLRYYDKEGLLPFVERSNGGMRVFKDIDYEWLKLISCLKKTGMSLNDIKEYIKMSIQGDETIEERLKLFIKQRDEVNRQIDELLETRELLDFKCWFYEKAKETGSTSVPRNMSIEELPEEFRAVKKRLMNK